jgi:hypothetical protein
MLCPIEKCLKWTHNNSNPFTNMLLLLVRDIKQLSTICKHYFKKDELYCENCHISTTPCWSTTIHYNLQTFMKHVTHPIFSIFLNTIHIRQATQSEINNVIYCCYIQNLIYYLTWIVILWFYVHIKKMLIDITMFFSTLWNFHYKIGY